MLANESYDDCDFSEFAEPSAPYRLQPWWFWNGEMEPERMRWQIAQMDEKGCGGFYVTPRQGMAIPYLSERYFERFTLALNEARRRRMLVGIMDEYPYPSGMAGGAATWTHPAFIRAELHAESFEIEGPQELHHLAGTGEILRAWAWPSAGGETDWSGASDLRPHVGVAHPRTGLRWGRSLTEYSYARFGDYAPTNELVWQVPGGNWQVMIFRVDRCRSFKYFGEFIDTCSPEAVAHFLSLTFEAHERGLGTDRLGTYLRSVFTDETQGGTWTWEMPRLFEERCGYDLRDHLPALIDDSFPDASRVRYDYLNTLHDLFMEAYHNQYADECERRGLLYTTEVPMLRNADEGAAHIPGVDHAHDRIGEGLPHGWLERNPTYSRHWPRFKSSVAAQYGRPRVAVEAFHSLGWGVRLADLKALIDRMAALGVNLFALHGFYYTAAGPAKFDAAPSEFYQHPWWRHFRKLADYAGRLSWIASRGRDVAPVALLDPVTS
ncbi:MAG: glycosyl hydrolase, partial [Armatimonadota bacterium]